MAGSCPRCGSKEGGFFRLCGLCQQSVTLTKNLDSVNKVRPVDEPEDD